MLDSIYVGISGLTGFADGLRNISNNVANMNSPGYKGTALQFSDFMYRSGPSIGSGGGGNQYNLGAGVKVGSAFTLFKQGQINQTSNPTDLAIDGNGFFVLRQGDKTYYTRNGQFGFDAQGFLVDNLTKSRVASLGSNGKLADIDLSALRSSPFKTTTEVKLTGNLSVDTTGGIATLSPVDIYDATGAKQSLKFVFTKGTDPTLRSWTVQVEDSSGNVVASGGEIRFNGDGSPQSGYTTWSFKYGATGANQQSININIGSANAFSGVTCFSAGTTSTIAVASQDGYAAGALTQSTFTADGTLSLQYANGQTKSGPQLALALFQSPQLLMRVGNNMFANPAGAAITLGTANSGGFGQIKGGYLEASNVDLAQSFSDLIIIQRGYQSSSQVIGAANEMSQQLLDLVKRR